MRYHWCSIPGVFESMFQLPPGTLILKTENPVYDAATLFTIDNDGLAVVQQQFDETTKHTWWGPITDPSLIRDIYYHPKFKDYFGQHSGKYNQDGNYPTVTVRQIMWALRMKPLKKERWETVFDRREI